VAPPMESHIADYSTIKVFAFVELYLFSLVNISFLEGR